MSTDPRVIPDEELADWAAAAERGRRDQVFCACGINESRIVRLTEHGKALAEQVDTLTRQLNILAESAEAVAERVHAAEQERDRARETRDRALRASEDAGQRLADRDKAIRDLTDKWRAEAGDDPRHGVVLRTAAAALRALLTEDGA